MLGEDVSDYVCELDAVSLSVAKKELHEDPKNRSGAIETLRTWINEQKHLKFTNDTTILLAYLRYAKFSQLKARQTIENYLSLKTENPTWFDNFDPLMPAVEKLVKDGFVFPLPGLDKNGCKRAVYRGAGYDPADWKNDKATFVRAMYTIFYYMIYDEHVQVNGIVYLCDMSGLTIAHQTFWSLDEMRKLLKCWQNTVPARYKALYQYNAGPVFEAMFAMWKPFMAKKLQDRFIMVGSNMESVYKAIPKESLPAEYLPDDYTGPNAGTVAELSANMLNDIRSPKMMRFLSLISHPNWKVDKAAKDADVPNASFRKLNID